MIEKISIYIVDHVLYKNEEVVGDEREVMLFGTTRIVEDIPKYVIIFLICYFTGNLKELLLLLMITASYKTFVGGVHANNNIACLIFTLLYVLLPISIVKYITIPAVVTTILSILVFAYSLYVIYKVAPSDTKEIPIINKQKRKKLKIGAFLSLIILYIITIVFMHQSQLINMILITVLMINLLTSNIAYKIFQCTRGKDSQEYKSFYHDIS